MGGPVSIGTLILGAVVYYFMGGNPVDYVAQNSGMQRAEVSPEAEEQKKFVSVVLADTEDVWHSVFRDNGLVYEEPRLVLFNGMVQSACGRASSAVGPFYCPGDKQLYLDLGFFNQLEKNLGASGDFAQAYVIAHEVGHHVQNLLGIERKFRAKQEMMGEGQRNQISVQMELQADCLAGVWAKSTERSKQVLEEGDIKEALGAATAVGDDALQKASREEVVPDSFTHGSSSQRVEAFEVGYRQGQTQACLSTFR